MGHLCHANRYFIDIYSKFASGNLDKGFKIPEEYNTVTAKVKVGRAANGLFIDVQVQTCIEDAVKTRGPYIEFVVDKIESLDSSGINALSCAFAIMMAVEKDRSKLPEMLKATDKKKEVKNKIHNLLSSNHVGWSRDMVGTLGPQFINNLGECMWYIDGHHHTLNDRACGVPVKLSHLAGYHHPESHGHKCKSTESLTREKVNSHSISLLHLTEQAYMKTKQWRSLREIILT